MYVLILCVCRLADKPLYTVQNSPVSLVPHCNVISSDVVMGVWYRQILGDGRSCLCPQKISVLLTLRGSIAKRGGCFQRRLFVYQFVRTITCEGLNVGRSNLAVRYIVQKSRPSSKVKVKCRQGHQGQKSEKLLSHPH